MSSIQCLTGTGEVSARWCRQPMLAVAIAVGRVAVSASSFCVLSACAISGWRIEVVPAEPQHMNG